MSEKAIYELFHGDGEAVLAINWANAPKWATVAVIEQWGHEAETSIEFYEELLPERHPIYNTVQAAPGTRYTDVQFFISETTIKRPPLSNKDNRVRCPRCLEHKYVRLDSDTSAMCLGNQCCFDFNPREHGYE